MVLVSAIGLYAAGNDSELSRMSVTVDCPEEVVVGEKFTVDYVLTTSGDMDFNSLKISLSPAMDNAKLLVSAPTTSSKVNTVVKNKVMNTTSSYKWTYSFRAEKAGRFNTPAFQITDRGEVLDIPSTSKSIKIVKEAISKDENAPAESGSTRVFMRFEVDRPTIELGDSLVLSVYLYSNSTELESVNFDRTISVEDCYMEPMDLSAAKAENTTIDGHYFLKWEIGSYKVIPLKKGRFEAGPITISGRRRVYDDNENIFFRKPKSLPFAAESNSVTFNVE